MPESAKRVKIRRKDLRGPDEFETLTGETLAWAQGHQTPLIVGGVAILAIVVGVLLVARARGIRNQEVAGQFRHARRSSTTAAPRPRRRSSRPSRRARPARRSGGSRVCTEGMRS